MTGYWYLGSPYSKYPGGRQEAFREICRIAGRFAEQGIPVYSPIAHTHSIAEESCLDPYDHKIWMPFDKPLMDGAKGLIVAMMDTWFESRGLREEIDAFNLAVKPIRYLDPLDLENLHAQLTNRR